MEAADVNFIKGIRYLRAAARCEEWSGDDAVTGQLLRLADTYRARGTALMTENIAEAAGETGAASADLPVGCHDQARQKRSQGGGAESDGNWEW